MHDIARAAGVSQAAVSYAYNQPQKLSGSRREYILKIAAELGYAGPNPAGRNLRTGQVGAIGLMITDSLQYAFDDPAAGELLKGISHVGELAEIALTLLPCPLESLRGAEGSGVLVRGAVDGFLVYAMPEGHPGIQVAMTRKLPIVIVDGPNPGGLSRVGIQDRTAAELAAEHLLALGHTQVGILLERLVPDGKSGRVSRARITAARDHVNRERLAGYSEALRRNKIRASTVPVFEAGGYSVEATRAAARDLLNAQPLTAIIAASDMLALAAIAEARERGLRVPEDLSVVGFDDVPAAQGAGLTTMRQPLVEKGKQAARLLLDIINGEPGREIILPNELVVRDTTALASVPARAS